MTDRPPAELEGRLSAAFGRQTLPPAPVSVYRHLERVVEAEPARDAWRPRRRVFSLVALLILLALAWIAFVGIILLGSAPAAAPDAETSPRATAITSVSGLPVRSVGDVLALRAAGSLRDEPVAVGGYWTNRAFGHSCAPPPHQPGALELYCSDGEFGITERPEAILELIHGSQVIPASGPHLTPFVDPAMGAAIVAFASASRTDPPIPIVVVGHFDDPRAAACPPEARQRCLDRLVIDRVVYFDRASAPAVTASPEPTPFPYDSPPPPPFEASRCDGVDDPEFVGWTTPQELGLQDRGGHIWAVVSKEMPLTDWAGPEDGRQYRVWGKRLCYAYEWEEGSMTGGPLPGSTYRLWADGTVSPAD